MGQADRGMTEETEAAHLLYGVMKSRVAGVYSRESAASREKQSAGCGGVVHTFGAVPRPAWDHSVARSSAHLNSFLDPVAALRARFASAEAWEARKISVSRVR